MKRKFIVISAVVVIFLLCLGVSGSLLYYGLPAQATSTFGPPAPGLSNNQRFFLSARLLADAGELTRPYNPNQGEKTFQVQLGESPTMITGHLQQQGLIPDAASLQTYLIYSGLDTTLQAGEYKISAGMTPVQIAHMLQDATPTEITFTIIPGWRLEEIAESLPTSGLSITAQQFLNASSNPPPDSPISLYLPPGATLEGFMPPGTYQLPRQTNVQELVSFLTNNFLGQLDHDILQGIQDQGLDLYQAVTLASIIQREAVQEDEMPLIGSVFANRLAAGMKLESDPTVQYALGYDANKQTWWKNPLTLVDLEINSPYNTYLYPALPPGPIASPGTQALRAVANPDSTPFYFFRALCDGSGRHVFAETFEEHLGNACP